MVHREGALSYLSLKYLAINVIVSLVFPAFHSSTINMWRKRKLLIARGTNLDSVAIRKRSAEVNYDRPS
jgi:hypothetical protein